MSSEKVFKEILYINNGIEKIEADYKKKFKGYHEDFREIRRGVLEKPTGDVITDYCVLNSSYPLEFLAAHRTLSELKSNMEENRGKYLGIFNVSKSLFNTGDPPSFIEETDLTVGKINKEGDIFYWNDNFSEDIENFRRLLLNLDGKMIKYERGFGSSKIIEIEGNYGIRVSGNKITSVDDFYSIRTEFAFGKEEILKKEKDLRMFISESYLKQLHLL